VAHEKLTEQQFKQLLGFLSEGLKDRTDFAEQAQYSIVWLATYYGSRQPELERIPATVLTAFSRVVIKAEADSIHNWANDTNTTYSFSSNDYNDFREKVSNLRVELRPLYTWLDCMWSRQEH
jgi:hypothetical protein